MTLWQKVKKNPTDLNPFPNKPLLLIRVLTDVGYLLPAEAKGSKDHEKQEVEGAKK